MTEDFENRGDGAQAIEGYRCSCGYKTADLNEFKRHLMSNKGHKSQGRINLDTGEIVMPPAKDRTPAQWQEAKYGKKAERGSKPAPPKDTIKQTDFIEGAQQIKFIPRVYTIDYSPILRAAYEAARRLWGWEVNFGDFLDTAIYILFRRCGITLTGYILEETEEERLEREKAIKDKIKIKPEEEAQVGSQT